MTKSELKSKMVVELASGELGLVVDNIVLFDDNTYMSLFTQNEDLTYYEPQFNIVRVYEVKHNTGFHSIIERNNLIPIWESKPLKKISKQELAKMGYKLEE